MEVLVAVIAFAGALLAVIATGALISRLRSEPKGWLIAWSITTASLSVSLGVIAVGYLTGFGAGTFRVYQLTGSMLAPLWLAVGVIQLLARKGAARFASWLLGIALTVIATVILAVDPVLQDKDFAKVLPLGSRHWDVPSEYLLLVVHVIVTIVLLAGLLLAVVRWRGGDDYDADNMHALLVLGPTGLALVGAVSFAVPGMFTALLLFVTAAAVWYAMLRPLAPYEDDEEKAADDDWENRLPTLRPPSTSPATCRSPDTGCPRRPPAAEPWPRSLPAAPGSATSSPSTARATRTSTTRRAWGSSPSSTTTGSADPPPGCSWRVSTACRPRPAVRCRPRQTGRCSRGAASGHRSVRHVALRPGDRRVRHPGPRVRKARGFRFRQAVRPGHR